MRTLTKNNNKDLTLVIIVFLLVLVVNAEFQLVFLQRSWGNIFALRKAWFVKILFGAVLDEHPHIPTVFHTHVVGHSFGGAEVHISLVSCIGLVDKLP